MPPFSSHCILMLPFSEGRRSLQALSWKAPALREGFASGLSCFCCKELAHALPRVQPWKLPTAPAQLEEVSGEQMLMLHPPWGGHCPRKEGLPAGEAVGCLGQFTHCCQEPEWPLCFVCCKGRGAEGCAAFQTTAVLPGLPLLLGARGGCSAGWASRSQACSLLIAGKTSPRSPLWRCGPRKSGPPTTTGANTRSPMRPPR